MRKKEKAMPLPEKAMVLGAGLGTRMRPFTESIPKPMVSVAGKPMIDHVFEKLIEAGVKEVIVNVHYCADVLEKHLGCITNPKIIISDERAQLLDTGGGIKNCLDHFHAPFFHLNADTLWMDTKPPNLERLARAFDPETMDALLLLAPRESSLGYEGRGDFYLEKDKRLRRRREGETAPYVFAGAAILKPEIFANTPEGAFSLNLIFDRLMSEKKLYGLELTGRWMHVGTPDAIPLAETILATYQ